MTFNDRIDSLMMQKMIRGERKHGPLNLETDPRDFVTEGVEELVDFLNYWDFAMRQGKVPFCKWASIDKDVRFIIWRLTCKSAIYGAGEGMDESEISSPG